MDRGCLAVDLLAYGVVGFDIREDIGFHLEGFFFKMVLSKIR